MQHTTSEIRSFAVELLRSPAYLAALEARLLNGDAPDIDYVRFQVFYGPVSRAIRWHPGLKLWIAEIRVKGRLVYRGQHRPLKHAVQAYNEALRTYRDAKAAA